MFRFFFINKGLSELIRTGKGEKNELEKRRIRVIHVKSCSATRRALHVSLPAVSGITFVIKFVWISSANKAGYLNLVFIIPYRNKTIKDSFKKLLRNNRC